MPKLYTANDSPFALAVESLLVEGGVAYERRALDLDAGAAKDPAYLAVNPLGMVPAWVEDDGFAVVESATIMRYVTASRSATHDLEPWYPVEPRARAAVDQWLDLRRRWRTCCAPD